MWDMVNTSLLNKKLMLRERGNIQWDGKVVALMIEKCNSRRERVQNKDIYNYCKEQGH
jgi:DNA primase large subunit